MFSYTFDDNARKFKLLAKQCNQNEQCDVRNKETTAI